MSPTPSASLPRAAAVLLFLAAGTSPAAQDLLRATTWRVVGEEKISATQGGLSATLAPSDLFGLDLTSGDLDDDGRRELFVGSPGRDAPGFERGAVYVLFLNPDGTVQAEQRIAEGEGGFSRSLGDSDFFGRGVACLGDLDDDGVEDLAVGAYRDDDGGFDAGAVYVLFMRSDGTVKADRKISALEGGLVPGPVAGDLFGVRVGALGDLDGDGVEDLAVAASFTDDGGPDRGAVWILFLQTDGTVGSAQKISSTHGGFTGALDDGDHFGTAVVSPGDVDGDGVVDLAVGAREDDDGGPGTGALWICFLRSDGTVKGQQKISALEGGFRGDLDPADQLGVSLAALGDVDGDGRRSVAVGAFLDDDGGTNRGAVWLLKLERDGTVVSHRKISQTRGGFGGLLRDGDNFGTGAELLDDLDGDGTRELAVGAWFDDDGGLVAGATWILSLQDVLRVGGGGPLLPAPSAGPQEAFLEAPLAASGGRTVEVVIALPGEPYAPTWLLAEMPGAAPVLDRGRGSHVFALPAGLERAGGVLRLRGAVLGRTGVHVVGPADVVLPADVVPPADVSSGDQKGMPTEKCTTKSSSSPEAFGFQPASSRSGPIGRR